MCRLILLWVYIHWFIPFSTYLVMVYMSLLSHSCGGVCFCVILSYSCVVFNAYRCGCGRIRTLYLYHMKFCFYICIHLFSKLTFTFCIFNYFYFFSLVSGYHIYINIIWIIALLIYIYILILLHELLHIIIYSLLHYHSN